MSPVTFSLAATLTNRSVPLWFAFTVTDLDGDKPNPERRNRSFTSSAGGGDNRTNNEIKPEPSSGTDVAADNSPRRADSNASAKPRPSKSTPVKFTKDHKATRTPTSSTTIDDG